MGQLTTVISGVDYVDFWFSAFGYRTINLVRDRPDLPELVAELRQLGADHVFTEEQFRQWSSQGLKSCKPRLALNGVGGRSALIISSALNNGSIMVTYGK